MRRTDMHAKEKWNLIVKQYKENYKQPERKIQGLWEAYCSEVLGYSKLLGDFDSQINKGIGSYERVVPDIILKKDGKDVFDIELKQYNLPFTISMEEQLKSYFELFHLSAGMIVCQKIYLFSYDYASNTSDHIAISFKEDNTDAQRLLELLHKDRFNEKDIRDFIIQKKKSANEEIVVDKIPEARGKRLKKPIGAYFVFTNEETNHKKAAAYEVYDSMDNNIGHVFMTHDERTPAFGHCEIFFYPEYRDKYQEYRRITSNGKRIKWDDLCERIKTEGKCKYFID